MMYGIACLLAATSLYGCNDNTPKPLPVQTPKTQSVKNAVSPPAAVQTGEAVQKAPQQEGYVYDRRDRRDPFVPLIVPRKKVQKGKEIKVGTLEGYDLSEFRLAAIAKKGRQYFALLTTPDNRSFTVHKGTVIGLNKGKVKNISSDRIILVEYSERFRGKLKPREIIIEFHKGEVE